MKKVIIAALALMLFSEGTYAAIAHAESKSTICITTKSNVDMPSVTGMQQPKKHHSKKHHSK